MGTRKLENNAMRLYQVSDRTGIPKEDIIAILSRAGFLILGDKSNFVLKTQHLNVIQQHFSMAVKSYYNDARKNYKKFDNQKLDNVKRFLSQFINDFPFLINSLPNDIFFKSSLNLEKVKEYFYSLIFSYYRSVSNNLYRELERLKYRLKTRSFKSYNDLRKKSSLFFFSGHYYTFSEEEDSNYAIRLTRFRYSKKNITEALKIFLIDLKHKFWNQQIYLLQG